MLADNEYPAKVVQVNRQKEQVNSLDDLVKRKGSKIQM